MPRHLDRPGCAWITPCGQTTTVLKQACSWRSLKLVDSILKLHMVVESEYMEVQRAICGMGGFVLTDESKKCGVPRDILFTKEKKSKRLDTYRSMLFSIEESVSKSTNLQKVAIEPKHKGGKWSEKTKTGRKNNIILSRK